jgi:hypothetical protein
MNASSLHRAALAAVMLLATSAYAPLWAQAGAGSPGAPPPAAPSSSPQAVIGSFRHLVPRDQRIVRALFDAQHPTAEGPAPLNLDQVAALRDRHGWAKAFKAMKAQGLIDAKSLAQLLSHAAHRGAQSRLAGHSAARMIAFTDGSGRSITAMTDAAATTVEP